MATPAPPLSGSMRGGTAIHAATPPTITTAIAAAETIRFARGLFCQLRPRPTRCVDQTAMRQLVTDNRCERLLCPRLWLTSAGTRPADPVNQPADHHRWSVLDAPTSTSCERGLGLQPGGPTSDQAGFSTRPPRRRAWRASRIARVRRGDDGDVEGAVGADWAGGMLAGNSRASRSISRCALSTLACRTLMTAATSTSACSACQQS